MTLPIVTIVIPAHNRGSTLPRCIESTLYQAYGDIEVIVVDDGSSDNTCQVVSKIIEGDSRVTYLRHERNRGAQAARNTGAKASRGEWIAFLDSDDYFLPGSIEKRLNAARKTGVKVVHTECTVVRDKDFQPFGVPPMEGKIYKDLLRRPGPMFQGMLICKDALEEVGFLDESIISYQEWDSSIRLAKCFEFAFVPEPTFVYDCRGTDTISKDMLRDANGYRQVVQKYTREILVNLGPKAMANHFSFIASRYQVAGNYEEAERFRMLSLMWWPFRIRAALNKIKSTAKKLIK